MKERKIVCENCGREFVQYGRGRARKCCNLPDCEAVRQKNVISRAAKEINFTPEINIIYSQSVVEDTGYGEVIQAAREYGATRFKLVEKIQEINNQVSETAKIEQDLLHKLEFMENVTDIEAQEIAISLKQNREKRRIVKNLQFLVKSLLDKMPLNHAEKFVRKGIDMINEQKYTPKALDELFEDDIEIQLDEKK